MGIMGQDSASGESTTSGEGKTVSNNSTRDEPEQNRQALRLGGLKKRKKKIKKNQTGSGGLEDDKPETPEEKDHRSEGIRPIRGEEGRAKYFIKFGPRRQTAVVLLGVVATEEAGGQAK